MFPLSHKTRLICKTELMSVHICLYQATMTNFVFRRPLLFSKIAFVCVHTYLDENKQLRVNFKQTNLLPCFVVI